jgi:hypothetical protein
MRWKIPPGGYLAAGAMNQANQVLSQQWLGNGRATNGKRRRRRNGTTAAKKAAASPRRRRRTVKATKFTKGSAAAKRHMAKLRAMRRK